jgi:hypothetical protein
MILAGAGRLPDTSRRCRRPDWERREPMGKVSLFATFIGYRVKSEGVES